MSASQEKTSGNGLHRVRNSYTFLRSLCIYTALTRSFISKFMIASKLWYIGVMNTCPNCASTTKQIKYGKNKAGLQRYKCRHCSRSYTTSALSSVNVLTPNGTNPYISVSTYRTSLELCAGGGGQALGLELAGFHHSGLVELDSLACQTLRLNRPRWNVIETDLRQFDSTNYYGVDLLSAGVPCPPFSVAGQQLGELDERNLFDDAVRLIDLVAPKAVLIENVRGLLDRSFNDYRARISRQIEDSGYRVFWKLLNASDYGVSQLRPRTVLVALRNEYADYFAFPIPNIIRPPTVGEVLYEEMSRNGWRGAAEWRTKANGIAPTIVGGSKKHGGPDLGPTRAKKAWALLGVNANGIADAPPDEAFEGMPKLTVRMAAVLQGFPPSWDFAGRKTPSYRQVGNAFPPPVAQAVGTAIINALNKKQKYGESVWYEKMELKSAFEPTLWSM
jgi:DNA (cytosine-5)-methyltransferase 1